MNDMIVGVDLAKAVFQLHGATTDGKLVFRKKVPRQHVIFRAELILGGCGQKPGLFSDRKAEAFTIFDRASATKRHLDAGFVIPADIAVHGVYELLH